MLKQGTLNTVTGEISFPTKSLVLVPVDAEGNPIPGGGTGGGGNSGGGTGDGIVKIDPAQNTVKVDGTVPVSGPVTDTQLRANPINVSGPLTNDQLRATAIPVSGPLTDAQLRATPLSVAGPLTDGQLRETPINVAGPLTDTQLRASAVPVSGPLTNAQYTAVAGTAAAAIYADPTGAANGTLISLLKGIYAHTVTNSPKLTEGVSRSGSVDVELESQVLAPANPNRVSLTIQNTSDADLYISEFGPASNDGTSAVIAAGSTFQVLSANQVTVTGDTAGQTWYATETSI